MTQNPQQKPSFLPEQPNRQTQPTPKVITKRNRKVEAGLWFSLLLSVGVLGFLGHVVKNEPDLIGLQTFGDAEQTALAFNGTQVALGNTAIALGDVAFDNNQTAAALDAQSALIEQRETQSAQNQIATETSIVIVNAQQATRAAIDFYSTQVAHEQEATQVQLNYQGTQSAINRDATAIALGFLTQISPQNPQIENTALPTLERRPFFEETFTSGISESRWRLSAVDDWRPSVDGVVSALRDGAWMLTQFDTLSSYTLALELIPIAGTITDFYVIINLPAEGSGLVLRLSYNGTRMTTAGLYQFERAQLEAGLFNESLNALYTTQLPEIGTSPTLALEIVIQDTAFMMQSNGIDLFSTTFSRPLRDGAVGLQLSAGTTVKNVAIYN